MPWPNVPPGYERAENGTLRPNPVEAAIVAEAFKLRAGGATIKAVRAYLRERGIDRSYHGVQSLLKSRVVVGELHFGALVNLDAHAPIVDRTTFLAVQGMSNRRGRRPSSNRLLARLGVLRCASCGGRMVIGMQTSKGRTYPFYRCSPLGDCTARVTISADMVEQVVVEHVQTTLAGVEGRASAQANWQAAEAGLARAESDLDAAIRTLSYFADEDATRDRLEALRQTRDKARERLKSLGAAPVDYTVTADDWGLLTPDGRRALVTATIEKVTVAKGRGPERITITAA